ncbi:hypothetical protein H4684_003689 [Desulfomicrobium macestii]|uniref:site-specific DNA-methyltransferase (adenine-specific) n=1 Tax=Desulfomicrobium macestii TaxID=90731 RepID=A0ABR9H8J2_9BACT|nr:DNA methyltransferase [Desulfomicrobium macestii]MBE1427005.1 hypothetical protein [Desulfomicrobium macestii]
MVDIAEFIARWSNSHGSERGNSQRFLTEFISILELPPMPTDAETVPGYEFEHSVAYKDDEGKTHDLRIDLYKRGCFVLESKQGIEVREKTPLEQIVARPAKAGTKRGTSAWDRLMDRAFHQAEDYVRRLPATEGRPPFIIVIDVGFSFDIYAEFSRTGGLYAPYPSPGKHRFSLADLAKPEVATMFKSIWEDPLSLDPSRRSAKVTREIAAHLAELAKSLEGDHAPDDVSAFLMRCLFTMFAEDVGLLPERCFQKILENGLNKPEGFAPTAQDLWHAMNIGGWSVAIQDKLLRFNGGIFADPLALPLNRVQIEVLLKAAQADWREVEPAIFGTLLERALDPHERHKLGAHFTPRAYVERLVAPTLITPLREEWRSIQAAAAMAAEDGDRAKALKIVTAFQKKLCLLRILDPACGTGNFLYVAFELLKRLEAEVVQEESRYGAQGRLRMEGAHVDPHQFLGLELNSRAARIAEMVLWIGYLQWHFRTHGHTPPSEPIIRAFRNIESRDAILAFDSWEYRADESGKPVMRWDGRSTKTDPVTGREVPDPEQTLPDMIFKNPRPASWPEADFILGNPPFLGGSSKRGILGQGYFEALAKAYPELPESCDLVMYWWHKAAEIVRAKKAVRFGFITTNSISQAFNRRIIALHLDAGLSVTFAIPDHPWVDSADGAAVRIALTVGAPGHEAGEVQTVTHEKEGSDVERDVTLSSQWGRVNADLTVGADVTDIKQLFSNSALCFQGVKLHGTGFIVTNLEAEILGLGKVQGIDCHIRPFCNGNDLVGKNRHAMVIDLFGLNESEVLTQFPTIFQWISERVKPERDQNNRESYKKNWWIFGEPRRELRPAIKKLRRYIATVRVAKHRIFCFLNSEILPESRVMAIALDDAFFLGVLSSRLHTVWSLAAGASHGVGNDPTYNNTLCFNPFPFPATDECQRQRIRDIAERLDAHRKARQDEHPDLTLTGMYNAMERLRSGQSFTPAENKAHEQALGTVLLTLHNELDAAVADAYGWPADLSDSEILSRLVELNKARAAEEKKGVIRWLRPEYQAPESTRREETPSLPIPQAQTQQTKPKAAELTPWPKDEAGRIALLMKTLRALGREATTNELAAGIKGASAAKIDRVAQSLAVHGLIRKGDKGYLG